jgi:hypothetical protein
MYLNTPSGQNQSPGKLRSVVPIWLANSYSVDHIAILVCLIVWNTGLRDQLGGLNKDIGVQKPKTSGPESTFFVRSLHCSVLLSFALPFSRLLCSALLRFTLHCFAFLHSTMLYFALRKHGFF